MIIGKMPYIDAYNFNIYLFHFKDFFQKRIAPVWQDRSGIRRYFEIRLELPEKQQDERQNSPRDLEYQDSKC